jgi:hypothetical protein
MALIDKKIISMILAESKEIEERCPGYRDEIINVIAEILELERNHRVQGTNIQQKISDKCSATARLVTEHQPNSDKD